MLACYSLTPLTPRGGSARSELARTSTGLPRAISTIFTDLIGEFFHAFEFGRDTVHPLGQGRLG